MQQGPGGGGVHRHPELHVKPGQAGLGDADAAEADGNAREVAEHHGGGDEPGVGIDAQRAQYEYVGHGDGAERDRGPSDVGQQRVPHRPLAEEGMEDAPDPVVAVSIGRLLAQARRCHAGQEAPQPGALDETPGPVALREPDRDHDQDEQTRAEQRTGPLHLRGGQEQRYGQHAEQHDRAQGVGTLVDQCTTVGPGLAPSVMPVQQRSAQHAAGQLRRRRGQVDEGPGEQDAQRVPVGRVGEPAAQDAPPLVAPDQEARQHRQHGQRQPQRIGAHDHLEDLFRSEAGQGPDQCSQAEEDDQQTDQTAPQTAARGRGRRDPGFRGAHSSGCPAVSPSGPRCSSVSRFDR